MKKKNWSDVRWTRFEVCDHVIGIDGKPRPVPGGAVILRNAIYTVEVRKMPGEPPFGDAVWLSFKTNDKQARHDWREMQRLKNEIVGPEVEAVEVFPAESRLVDTSNQYHLFAFPWMTFPDRRLPFGYLERIVSEGSHHGAATGPGARQRPFPEDARPVDCLTLDDLSKLREEDTIRGRCPICGAGFIEHPDRWQCMKTPSHVVAREAPGA